jgi:hypothetical protein
MESNEMLQNGAFHLNRFAAASPWPARFGIGVRSIGSEDGLRERAPEWPLWPLIGKWARRAGDERLVEHRFLAQAIAHLTGFDHYTQRRHR